LARRLGSPRNGRSRQAHRPRAPEEACAAAQPIRLFDQEGFLLELAALHLVPHPPDGTVSPNCFCGLEIDRELEFGDLIKGDLSRVCAVQGGVSGFELEVVKMLQV